MKKIFAFLMLAILLIAVSACGSKQPAEEKTDKGIEIKEEQPQAEEIPQEQEPAVQEEQSAPEIADDGGVSDIEASLNDIEGLENELSADDEEDLENDLLVELY